ncbi:cadherin-related protein : Uncharacterized protein OS=Cylindrospermopsis raciborskii CS-505 GN=CRC_01020 PE=3 SV=1: MAM: Lectin_C: Lectin_C: PKD [Gemmata massiliana]|uniref:C-type lectin domain-containing protein n=1 Tax=Gemmata massiliana TaxID=1210884 RepID=A0A6P2CYZ4_9BACT|nr:PKD domain-containing protein [Gemmata massiliana]VTR94201.1 cadherin-related protein : Uncharacterized protein OS=Cylindrospermopsis raciborskii CS-505 GN=CRC_01020 PE=3 SV=1: MAM: Lectin_C: Lectin_C: PKD [Gemmata massiliana]
MFSLKSWLRRWKPVTRKPSSRRSPRRAPLGVARLEDRLVPSVLFSEDFSDNSAGWTLGTEWQIGSATLSAGQSTGNPDPALDHTPTGDNGVAGVKIGGNAATTVHDYYYLTSPTINTASATAPVTLEFYRWLNSDYAPFMANRVEVFDGASWQAVWQTAGSPGIQDSSWQRQQFDVSAYKNANMQVRFGFSVGSSGAFTMSSWNIDDVTITASDPPPTENGLSAQIVGAPANSSEGSAITVSAAVTDTVGTGPYAYVWSVTKNGASYAAGTSTDPTFTFTPDDNGTYLIGLTVTAPGGRTSGATTGTGPTDVLIIYDALNAQTQSLKNSLEAAGFNVALSSTDETLFNGTNPSLAPFEAVIHLNGTTWSSPMPVAGQNALVGYVQSGGAYLGSEWSSYETQYGSMGPMRDLALFDYQSERFLTTLTLTEIAAQSAHPILANIPASVSFSASALIGPVHTFATNPATVLMTDQFGNAALAVREFGTGRVVGFHNAGNYSGGTALSDTELQQLYIDGVKWASRRGAGGPGASATILVTNVAPTATLSSAAPVPEAVPVTVTFTGAADASTADQAAGFRYSFATSAAGLATSYAGASPLASGQVTFPDNGTYTVFARIFDKDGGFRDYTTNVTVTNSAPTATISTGGSVGEGSAATVSLINPVDSATDLSAGLRYSFSTSAANLATSYATAGAASAQQFSFPENGTYTVFARVFDKDGGSSDYQTTVTVTNVAPIVTITGAPANSPEGTAITLGSTVSDPGSGDTFTYAWSVTKNGVPYATGTPTNGSTFTFTPNDNGTYVVSLIVTDDDGGVGIAGTGSFGGPTAGTTDVLIIYDAATAPGTIALRNALQAAGMNVSLSTTDETLFNGSNPFLTPYEAVIHLNGITWPTDMPLGGQTALVNYVQNGGGYIGNEWNAYEFSVGRMQQMRDLILLNSVSNSSGNLTLTDVPGQSGHPILANVPSPAFFSASYNVGQVRSYATQPAVALMRDQFGNDAVAVREFGIGHVVAFHHAGNYFSGTLNDADVLQLYVDGVKWAARASGGQGATITVTNAAPTATDVSVTPVVNEGGTATVTGRITDPGAADTHTVTVSWGDGTSSTAVVNADRTFTATHVYTDDNPTGTPADVYQVGVSVRDDDGGVSGGGTQELVTNGGFESGFTGWTTNVQSGTWSLNSGSTDPDGPGLPTAPISGQFDALAAQSGPSRLILSAPIVVPTGITSAVLSWSDRIRNHYSQYSDPNQEWRVRVLDAAGNELTTVFSTNPGDPLEQFGPNHRSVDLTALLQGRAGQTIRLSFELDDNLFYFNVNLDDVSLLTTTGPGIPVTVTNVAPTAPVLQVSPAVGEDGTVTLTGTFTDAGLNDTHTVTVDWGDGSQTVLGGGATVPVSQAVEYNGHRYYVIRQAGLSWFEAQNQAQRLGGNLVTINDAAENTFVSELLRSNFGYYALAWIGLNDEANEGQFGWVSGDPITYTNWFVQDGEPNDYPPQVTEDFAITNYAYGYGPGWWNDLAGTRDSAIYWGAYAVVEVNPTRTFTLSHRYADDTAGAYTIGVTVTDDDTGASSATTTATVTNAAPTDLTVSADAVTINEDGSVTLTGSFTDRGTLDAHTVTIDWKDGTTSQVAVPGFPGAPSPGVNLATSAEFGGHTYHFISTPLAWADAEAEARRMGGHLVTINSDAENLFLFHYVRRAALQGDVQTWIGLSDGGTDGPLQWASGESLGYTNWATGQPSDLVGPTGYAFNYNNVEIGARWGAFSAETPLFAVIEVDGKRTFTATHRYLDDAPSGTASDTYAIGVTVTDDDAGTTSTTVPVTVNNIAPVIGSLTGPVAGTQTTATPGGAPVAFSGVRGQPLAFSVGFSDTGTIDTHEVQWNFGDGTVSGWLPASGSTASAPAHAFAATGTYTVTVTVRDDDGGTVSFAQQVVIKTIELQADPTDPSKTALVVGGTTGTDQIQLSGSSSVTVNLNGSYLGSFARTGRLAAYGQGGNDQVQISGNFEDVLVDAGAGTDQIQLSGTFRDLFTDGGAGNDQTQVSGNFRDAVLSAGSGNDTVQVSGNFNTTTVSAGDGDDNVQISGTFARVLVAGGAGNDVLRVYGTGPSILVGGDGNDELVGSTGRSLLIGGRGADRITGSSAEDVLIAGFTAYDDDFGALTALHGVWVDPTKNYAQRVAALQLAGTIGGIRLAPDTVFDDDSADRLTGAAGRDWFLFAPTRDDVTDDAANESLGFTNTP